MTTLRTPDWAVYAKPPFGGADQALAYLARYTHRVAISQHRLIDRVDGVVRFRYRDDADHDRLTALTLDGEDFLRRFLLHVLPTRFVRIRHAGLSGNRDRHARLDRCRALLGARPPMTRPSVASPARVARRPRRLACVGPCPPPASRRHHGLASTPSAPVTHRRSLPSLDPPTPLAPRPAREPGTP